MTEKISNNLQGITQGLNDKASTSKVTLNDDSVPSFKDTLKTFLTDVNKMQNHADRSIERMVAGEITDVHQVMLAVEEANLSFNLMMEIRTKMVDAYQELLRMQV
jgi:flagellar hook-basal body complex protein FliE